MTDFLTRLRALDAAASKAPWSDDASDPSDVVVWGVRQNDDERMLMNVGGANPQQVGVAFDIDAANAALIVALRNAAPRIAAALKTLADIAKECPPDNPCADEYDADGVRRDEFGRACDYCTYTSDEADEVAWHKADAARYELAAKARAALAALDKEMAP